MTKDLAKLRAYFLFTCLFFFVFALTVSIKLFAGEPFSMALRHSITDVPAFEWLMIVLLCWTTASSLNSGAWNTKGLGLLISELKRKHGGNR